MPYHTTGYQVGDEKEILLLFKEAFHKELPMETWRWRFKENPLGGPYIQCVWDEELLVGHNAITPMQGYLHHQKQLVGYNGTSMGRAGYVGTLPLAVKKLLLDTPQIKFRWAFPNQQSFVFFIKILRWQYIGDLSFWVRSIGDTVSEAHCKQFFSFTKRHAEVFESQVERYAYITQREVENLTWRFIDKPNSNYECFEYVEKGELKGWMVLNVFQGEELRYGQIIDVIVDHQQVFEALVNHAAHCFKDRVDVLKLWMTAPAYQAVLQDMGFMKEKSGTPLVVWPHQETFELEKMYLTMSDSDVF